MALTAAQENWFKGFWGFFQGQDRPPNPGPKQNGWDAAKRCASDTGGGY